MSKLGLEKMGAKKYLMIGTGLALVVVVIAGALLIARVGDGPEGRTEATMAGAQTPATDRPTTQTTAYSDERSSLVQPQTEPVTLGQVDSPPEKTLAFISADDYSTGSEYSVTFVPFGVSVRPNTLVIQVLASSPVGEVDKPFDFEGRNVLVDTSALSAPVSTGGTYMGTLRLVKQESSLAPGGVLAPVLVEASLVE